MQPEPTVPCLLHVAPCKGRVSVLCSFTLSTGILRCVLPEPSPGKGNPAPWGFLERFSSPLITFVLSQLQAPAPFLISCPASYYKQRSLQVAPCSSSLFFSIRLGHNCHSFPLITPPWLKVQRMAFVWQIKGRQGFEGTHCCYGDSPNIMWLALLVSVKAKASVISSRDVRREVLSYGQNIWPSTV